MQDNQLITKSEVESKLDILVNNAGNNRPEHFTKVKQENMKYLTDLNMKAAFNVAQLSSKKMIKAKNRKKIGTRTQPTFTCIKRVNVNEIKAKTIFLSSNK